MLDLPSLLSAIGRVLGLCYLWCPLLLSEPLQLGWWVFFLLFLLSFTLFLVSFGNLKTKPIAAKDIPQIIKPILNEEDLARI